MAVGGESKYGKGSKIRDDGKLYKESKLWCEHGKMKDRCLDCESWKSLLNRLPNELVGFSEGVNGECLNCGGACSCGHI